MGWFAVLAVFAVGWWLLARLLNNQAQAAAAEEQGKRVILGAHRAMNTTFGSALAGPGAPDFGPPPQIELEPSDANAIWIDAPGAPTGGEAPDDGKAEGPRPEDLGGVADDVRGDATSSGP